MTCPDLDRLVDAAVAGLPGADARLAAHADACAACLAEADCEHAPVPEMALLADVHCPPAVVAAALADAHRAGVVRIASDRPAASRPSARPVWTRRVAVGIAFAAALLALRAVWPSQSPDAPRVAVTPAPARPTVPSVAPEPTPDPIEIAAATPPVAIAPRATTRPPARPATRPDPRPAPPSRTAPQPAGPTPVAPPGLDLDPPDDALAAVTPADSAAARSDLLLALAIVGRAQRTADDAVSAEMRRVSDALEPARTL